MPIFITDVRFFEKNKNTKYTGNLIKTDDGQVVTDENNQYWKNGLTFYKLESDYLDSLLKILNNIKDKCTTSGDTCTMYGNEVNNKTSEDPDVKNFYSKSWYYNNALKDIYNYNDAQTDVNKKIVANLQNFKNINEAYLMEFRNLGKLRADVQTQINNLENDKRTVTSDYQLNYNRTIYTNALLVVLATSLLYLMFVHLK